MKDQGEVQQAIFNKTFAGGWTNTQEGIEQCVNNLDSSTSNNQKVIVLITDGTPSWCNYTLAPNCVQNSGGVCCVDSLGGPPLLNPVEAAEHAATYAAEKNYPIIPVGITAGSEFNITRLNRLARCPNEGLNASTPCDKYTGLNVSTFDALNSIVKALAVTAGCA